MKKEGCFLNVVLRKQPSFISNDNKIYYKLKIVDI